MGCRISLCLILIAATLATLSAFQNFSKPWREYPAVEYNTFPTPPDYQEKTEFVFARLMYPNASFGRGFGRRFGGGDWRQGGSGAYWTMDYPRSDRHLLLAMRRLSRIHARSVEQAVNSDDGDHYDWPWLYAVETGHWELTPGQVAGLREYFLRGGFLMVDDFHGSIEWQVFTDTLKRVFPDRAVVDIPNADAIFHILYDLDDRIQVPGFRAWLSGVTHEQDGYTPAWRGVYDDKGRIMVAICHNMDLGDSWEHADDPEYPEKFSALGIRIAVNYINYAMTH
jgi:uncharacterized protein DUF4159